MLLLQFIFVSETNDKLQHQHNLFNQNNSRLENLFVKTEINGTIDLGY